MTTLKLQIDITPTPYESADFIRCNPAFNSLYDECHERYPDYAIVEDLDAATEYVVTAMEAAHAVNYGSEDWKAIRQNLCEMVRGGLELDRQRFDRSQKP